MVCTRPLISTLTLISRESLELWQICHQQGIVRAQVGIIGLKGPGLHKK